MGENPFLIEVRGGPWDGLRFAVEVREDKGQPGEPSPHYSGVPLYRDEDRYLLKWEDIERMSEVERWTKVAEALSERGAFSVAPPQPIGQLRAEDFMMGTTEKEGE